MAGIVNNVYRDVSRGNRLTTAKKSTKKCAARAKLMFYQAYHCRRLRRCLSA